MEQAGMVALAFDRVVFDSCRGTRLDDMAQA
jgi:hypothetical protein